MRERKNGKHYSHDIFCSNSTGTPRFFALNNRCREGVEQSKCPIITSSFIYNIKSIATDMNITAFTYVTVRSTMTMETKARILRITSHQQLPPMNANLIASARFHQDPTKLRQRFTLPMARSLPKEDHTTPESRRTIFRKRLKFSKSRGNSSNPAYTVLPSHYRAFPIPTDDDVRQTEDRTPIR